MEKARCDSWYRAALWPKVIFGIVAADVFIWDLYTDSMAYRGNDFYKAATVSTLSFLAGIAVGLAITSSPIGLTILGGAVAGTLIGYGGDYLKKQWIGY